MPEAPARSYTCVDCDAPGALPARGRPRLRCDACIIDYKNRQRRNVRAGLTASRTCPTCAGDVPHGVRTVHCRPECRPSPPRRERVCAHCGGTFNPAKSEGTCSDACRLARRQIGWRAAEQVLQTRICQAPCRGCRRPINRPGSVQFCLPCVRERNRARLRRKSAVRRRGAVARGPLLTLPELGARDGWRCHLCRRRVDRRLPHPHPLSATTDHLIPVSVGGAHESVNLRLAHLRCNMLRGTGGAVQLLLVG